METPKDPTISDASTDPITEVGKRAVPVSAAPFEEASVDTSISADPSNEPQRYEYSENNVISFPGEWHGPPEEKTKKLIDDLGLKDMPLVVSETKRNALEKAGPEETSSPERSYVPAHAIDADTVDKVSTAKYFLPTDLVDTVEIAEDHLPKNTQEPAEGSVATPKGAFEPYSMALASKEVEETAPEEVPGFTMASEPINTVMPKQPEAIEPPEKAKVSEDYLSEKPVQQSVFDGVAVDVSDNHFRGSIEYAEPSEDKPVRIATLFNPDSTVFTGPQQGVKAEGSSNKEVQDEAPKALVLGYAKTDESSSRGHYAGINEMVRRLGIGKNLARWGIVSKKERD